ncbi:MAG: nicotinate phosphoribosyltransferase [Prevotella sp.]|nr:nicotinate phosphoribosyltransferase [Prevotella sp.]MDD7461697.1 nicotinate phosphoribosyltransferase [Prevotellaceae bacterium]MDY3365253.1 nicotinate phosphoribosyltransferase [Prevotella sp.]MDY3852231.1 nicotinate phosphoribosyltransferase [Prevotella sp.]
MRQIINHFTDNDAYTFSCQYYVLQKYPRAEVEYTFFDRNHTQYPKGFAALLQEQVDMMPNVVITDEEIAFMQQRMYYLPQWYFTFLKGYRFDPAEVMIAEDEEGKLSITIRGKWYSAIMWEMPLLSIISELMHELLGDIKSYQPDLEYERAKEKTREILQNGLVLSDMGTRRRLSFNHHDRVTKAMKEVSDQGGYEDETGFHHWTGLFVGTSNVYLAMKHDLKPIGTMSHQIIEFEENVSGIFECNFNVMRKFSDVYDGDNGTYLYDCFGDKVFFNNLSKRMAMMFTGLRVDSGVEEEQTEKIIEKYKSLGIDPATKQVIYSNGLNIRRAIEIHKYVNGRVQDSYGMGTFLTCDVTNCKPMNIVIKLTKCRITERREWHDCVKLSCDKGKTLGNPEKCAYLLKQIG